MEPNLIGIIGGNGKMGKFFTRYLESLNYKVIISDIKTQLTNIELAKQSDVVIVSVPISKTLDVIKEITPHTKKGSLLTDLTSIKSEPVKEMLKSKSEVIGCHPIFGPFSGIKNQVVVLCPARGKKWLPWFKKTIKKGGGITKIVTPEEHDKLMAVIQVLTHFSDISLAYALKELNIPLKKFLEFQSPPYRLKLDMVGRILAQDPDLYGSILFSNPDRLKVIDTYINTQKLLRKIAKKKEKKKFITFFNSGAKYLGKFKDTAMRESNFLVNTLNELVKIHTPKQKPQKTDIAVLGPANTFSDEAAKKYEPQSNRYYCQNISEVFEKVRNNEVKAGVVPIEVKGQGSIRVTIDELFHSSLYIKKQIILPINHCLVALSNIRLNKVRYILSKEQPINQCSHFINKYLPNAKTIYTTSTAEGMKKIVRENISDAVGIGNKNCASQMKLAILKENIGNEKNNSTRFIVINKERQGEGDITSIMFYFYKDQPGSLYQILKIFADLNINLSKLETFATGKEFGEYMFYIDFKGLKESKEKALKKLEKLNIKLKFLGSYN